MLFCENSELLGKRLLASDLYHFSVQSNNICDNAKPGQFLQIQVDGGLGAFLRRPISIFNIGKSNGIVEFIFQAKGPGTKLLSKKRVGEQINIIGPIGDGVFAWNDCNNVMIIGGGIGIFPLYLLAKQLTKKNNVCVRLGFRSKDHVVLEDEFREHCDMLKIFTDDGTYGFTGNACEDLGSDLSSNNIDAIFACGPLPMLRYLKEIAALRRIPCQVSLEERMGCSIGACMGCAVKLHDAEIIPPYARVCKDGPVFDAVDVEF
jgi:dihydroorotate dehydrogenase electron transfer subunit